MSGPKANPTANPTAGPAAAAAAIPAVILAGGLSQRMGGGDKALLALGDRPMLARVIARLAPQAGPLALNANGPPERFAAFGLPVLADPLPDHPGPLAGVLAAMLWARGLGCRQVATVAADTPFFPADLVVRLIAGAGRTGLAIAASRDPGGRLRRHPTFGIWPVALAGDLATALGAGQRRVGAWALDRGAAEVEFDGPGGRDPFFNVNTPEELAEARTAVAAGVATGGLPG